MFSGTRCSKKACKSSRAEGSAFSKITRLQLVCRTKTVAVPVVIRLADTISWTRRVISYVPLPRVEMVKESAWADIGQRIKHQCPKSKEGSRLNVDQA